MKTSMMIALALVAGCGSAPARATLGSAPAQPPRDRRIAEAPGSPAVPDDFAIAMDGGPVARWMAAGMTVTRTRIEPGAQPGSFQLVVTEHDVDEMGIPGADREVARLPVPADRVAALFAIVRDRRAELEGPCIDMRVMDGATTSIRVRAEGAEHVFRCTNASTPAFTALSGAYSELVRDHAPAS